MERQTLKIKNTNSNEKGVALAMVLILSAIALAIMAALVYMLITGTQISGMQKRYKTALEAGMGGSDILYQVVAGRINSPAMFATDFPFLTNYSVTTSTACLDDKMVRETALWGASCNSTMSINSLDPTTYDFRFEIGTGTPYTVYAKIVDTITGNSSGDIGLTEGGAVESAGAEVMGIPFMYVLEVEAQNAANPAERAKLSILYEY